MLNLIMNRNFIYLLIENSIKNLCLTKQAILWLLLVLLTTSNMVGRFFTALAAIAHPIFDRRQVQRYHEIGDDRRRINLAIFTPYIIMTWFSASVTLLVSYQLAMRGASLPAVTFLSVWLACWFVITWRGIKYKIAY